MNDAAAVLAAAEARAAALAESHAEELQGLLHEEFRWVSHTGEQFDRERYVQANIGGQTLWRRQDLGQPEVIVVGDAAVLRAIVDTIQTATGQETYRMPMTRLWVRVADRWQCLAGHAGPRVYDRKRFAVHVTAEVATLAGVVPLVAPVFRRWMDRRVRRA